jgi:GNAT superfamily N-acetyltransferase
MLSDGYHAVADGKVASVVTSLEMTAMPALRPDVGDPTWLFARLERPRAEEYRNLYRLVGQEWLWFSRLELTDAALEAIIHSPQVEIYRLDAGAGAVGMLELDFRVASECELGFFGLTSALTGGRAGRWLMNRAIERAWARSIRRFWVHTCNLDHHAALAFYQRSGFTPYRLQIEIADDPRLTGVLPETAAPHVPIIRARE